MLRAAPLGTAFTCQGKLTDGGPAANGLYDFEFTLFDAPSGGTRLASVLPMDSMPLPGFLNERSRIAQAA